MRAMFWICSMRQIQSIYNFSALLFMILKYCIFTVLHICSGQVYYIDVEEMNKKKVFVFNFPTTLMSWYGITRVVIALTT